MHVLQSRNHFRPILARPMFETKNEKNIVVWMQTNAS